MTPERARELAIAILFGMVGNNDEIVNDPSRWGDPLQSFSFDEVAVKIEEAILTACLEQKEFDARLAENCVVAKPNYSTRDGRKPPKPSMLRIEIASSIRSAK